MVKKGVEFWNQAFEKIGISDAIVVEYQDRSTNEHMDKDPEDVRYNFVRWLNNNVGTAIGPSRVHPETGQILDADIVLTDGWIRHFDKQFGDFMPLLTMEGMSPETLAWLARHPSWDPRVRFADPSQREHVAASIRSRASQPYAGEMQERLKTQMLGDDPLDGLVGRTSQVNGNCMAADGLSLDMATMRLYMSMSESAFADDEKKDEGKKEEPKKDEPKKEDDKKPEDKKDEPKKDEPKKDEPKKDEPKKEEPKKEDKESLLDGMPESFVGPLLADLVAHEVGHTLGLRHNFKASSIYELKEINSAKVAGKKSFAGSVMDYLPVNLRMKEGELQGDYGMLTLDHTTSGRSSMVTPSRTPSRCWSCERARTAVCNGRRHDGPRPIGSTL